MIDKLLDPKWNALWLQCFTHATADPDVTKNYEQMENIGDAVLASVFRVFLTERFPKIDAVGLSEYPAQYMSKRFQSQISQGLGLPQWMIAPHIAEKTYKLETDILESFTGALYKVGDLLKPGVGTLLVTNMIRALFADREFDVRMKHGTAKTQIDQMNSFNIKKSLEFEPSLDVPGKPSQKTVLVKFLRGTSFWSDLIRAFMREKGSHPNLVEMLRDERLGGATGDVDVVVDLAFEDALEKLRVAGITWEWARAHVAEKSLNRVGADVARSIQEMAKLQGLRDLEFHLDSTSKQVLQLLAKNKTGEVEVLCSESIPRAAKESEIDEARKKLAASYLGTRRS